MSKLLGLDGKPVSAQELPRDMKPFADLLSRPEDAQKVFIAIQGAIMKSFVTDAQRDGKVPTMSRNELKHRFKICEAFIRRCRGDLGFSLEKTLDLMAHALRCELDGKTYEPETGYTSKLWTPT